MSRSVSTWENLMARYSAPEYSREVVNKAGKLLVEFQKDPFVDGLGPALDVVDNWRAAHAYPAQCFYMTVKRHARNLKREDGVAQRIKRMPSIVRKLVDEKAMRLSQMQDIAGVRTVLKNLHEVASMRASLVKSRWNHVALEPKDYINFPKPTGYRGIHLKYKYQGEGAKAAFNDLKVEIQIRTQLQHQWATSVEAADNFTKQSLKHSKGDEAWKRFFALMGSVFALKEKCPTVPNTPTTYDELALEIYRLDTKHNIAGVFAGLAKALIPHVEGDSGANRYYLVSLDPIARRARIRGFKEKDAKIAQAEYSLAESRLAPDSPTQVVLVSTSSIRALKRVYPNYFLDTVEFSEAVAEVIAHGEALEKKAPWLEEGD